MPPAPAIFFLSDYGTADEFVGVVHAVLHRLAPQVPVVDLSHQVAPFDVTGAAAMLDRCVPYLGSGVVLAVVDPGVGTDRRALALRTAAAGGAAGAAEGAGPAGPAWLVGPDNGLLVPMAEAYGGVGSVVGIDRDGPVLADHRRVAGGRGDPGPTFDGRDVFAPAAAHLVLGGDPGLLGPELDPASLVTVDPGPPGPGRGRKASTGPAVLTSVASVDRFGNVQLEANPAAWAEAGFPAGHGVVVTIASGPVPARRVRAYGELGEGELGLLTDGTGHLALVLDRESAAAALHPVEVGAAVRIVPKDG